MTTGQVKLFNRQGGYGVIQADERGDVVFFRAPSCRQPHSLRRAPLAAKAERDPRSLLQPSKACTAVIDRYERHRIYLKPV